MINYQSNQDIAKVHCNVIFLLIIFDIFSSPTKTPTTDKQILKTKDINNDNFNSSEFSKTHNQTVKNTKRSVTNVITWIFIIFCFVTCVSRHHVGATCNDGTSSNATGSGACSHHNGVNNWKYEYWWD